MLANLEELKILCAIAVAASIQDDIRYRKAGAGRELRLRIAADALDKTMPLPSIYTAWATKLPEDTEGQFLLKNLSYLSLLPVNAWPRKKVPSHKWQEYSHIMRGLESFLQAEGETPPLKNKELWLAMFDFVKRQQKNIKLPLWTQLLHLEQQTNTPPY